MVGKGGVTGTDKGDREQSQSLWPMQSNEYQSGLALGFKEPNQIMSDVCEQSLGSQLNGVGRLGRSSRSK